MPPRMVIASLSSGSLDLLVFVVDSASNLVRRSIKSAQSDAAVLFWPTYKALSRTTSATNPLTESVLGPLPSISAHTTEGCCF